VRAPPRGTCTERSVGLWRAHPASAEPFYMYDATRVACSSLVASDSRTRPCSTRSIRSSSCLASSPTTLDSYTLCFSGTSPKHDSAAVRFRLSAGAAAWPLLVATRHGQCFRSSSVICALILHRQYCFLSARQALGILAISGLLGPVLSDQTTKAVVDARTPADTAERSHVLCRLAARCPCPPKTLGGSKCLGT
jgi:hypothetical protein